ncbi:MAG TPA: type II toxin-antitoxin system mRNA interferase toxin, RelE/StbE family [Candidatus Scatomorpha stercorigallinarum]|nr:type II toxin-antitoxin system mRNA interferase toxin, RelE/StbE family [Candidatus Scatomorpha stercorigallinarum]
MFQPDWLLVYEVNNDELILYLIRTGSRSDLF